MSSCPMTEVRMALPANISVGLVQLLHSFDYAAESSSSVWDFASEIGVLRAVGMTLGDFRWLVAKGFVQHGEETSVYGDGHRNLPSNFPEDQWCSCAGRLGPTGSGTITPRPALSFPKWHYINKPYVPEGSQLKESDFRAESPNVVTQIKDASQKVKDGTPKRSRSTFAGCSTWLAMSTSLARRQMFSERFPKATGAAISSLFASTVAGRRSSILSGVACSGKSISWSSIQGTVAEVASLRRPTRGKSMGISSPQPRRTPGPAKVLPPRKSTPTWTGSWTLRTRRKGRARKTFRT